MNTTLLITQRGSSWMSHAEFYHIFNILMDNPNSDIFLIERLKTGDNRALYSLYDKYSAALFGVIVRMCRDRELAEDLLQESFVKIWEKIGSYDPAKGRFYTWAYRIARNTTLNHLRKNNPLIQTDDISVYDTKEIGVKEPEAEELNGMLKKLDPHHQQAIELVYFQGYTHREAHQEMDVPLGTFKSYIKQALSKLREMRADLYLIGVIIEVLSHG